MFKRLNEAGSEISYITHEVIHDKHWRGIENSFRLPTAYVGVVKNTSFWNEVVVAHSVYGFICKCIGLCESDEVTMNTAYACALSIRVHIREHIGLNSDQKKLLDNRFMR